MTKTTMAMAMLVAATTFPMAAAQDSVRGCEALASTTLELFDFTARIAVGSDDREGFCQIINATIETIEELQAETRALRTELELTKDQLPPDDAILIVDDADGCPMGWRDLAATDPTAFAGRVALAATGDGPYHYRATGGAPTHTLTVEEMPAHSHQVGRTADVGAPGADVFLARNTEATMPHYVTSSSGHNAAHNNMPPYIALYFCKMVY